MIGQQAETCRQHPERSTNNSCQALLGKASIHYTWRKQTRLMLALFLRQEGAERLREHILAQEMTRQ
jgi:hypothetical protein